MFGVAVRTGLGWVELFDFEEVVRVCVCVSEWDDGCEFVFQIKLSLEEYPSIGFEIPF